MKLFERILFRISVPRCINCGEALEIGEKAICNNCKRIFEDTKERNCSICARPLYSCDCTSKYLESHFVHKLIKVFRYKPGEETVQNKLIYSLKRENRRDVVDFLSEELKNSILASVKITNDTVITSVPRRKRAIAKYGIDHSRVLARATAKKLSAEYIPTLKSLAKKPQKKAVNIDERIENAKFKPIKQSVDLEKKTVILIDDIVTTGASMGAAAFNLKSMGAKRIIGAALSVAYKDNYVPLSKDDRFKG